MAHFNFCFLDLCPTHVSQPDDTYFKQRWPGQMADDPKNAKRPYSDRSRGNYFTPNERILRQRENKQRLAKVGRVREDA